MPAGFLEKKHRRRHQARSLEEAHARIEIDALLGLYNIRRLAKSR